MDLVGIPCMSSICNKKIWSILWKLDKYKITLYWKAHSHKTTNNSTGETGNIVEGVKAKVEQRNRKTESIQVSYVDSINVELAIYG